MVLLIHSLILLASFYFLAVICDRYFVKSLDKIADKLKMSSDMAGATLMAIGSSAPELFVSFIALFKPGNEAIGAGTIVGSAIFNILVIIGAVAIIKKAIISWQPIIRDVLFYSISIILLLIFFRDGSVNLTEASIFVGLYVLYIIAIIKWKKILPYTDNNKNNNSKDEVKEEVCVKKNFLCRIKKIIYQTLDFIFPRKNYWLTFFLCILIIGGLSWVLVESAIVIAETLKIPSVIIGLTILAIGTSIPDLVSSVIVAKQGRGGMAISNSIGSNIFDILIGLGLPWVIMTSIYGVEIPVITENLNSSIFLLFATVIAVLFLLILHKWKLKRTSGLILIGFYITYLIWAITKAL